jgi:hypothetical protein
MVMLQHQFCKILVLIISCCALAIAPAQAQYVAGPPEPAPKIAPVGPKEAWKTTTTGIKGVFSKLLPKPNASIDTTSETNNMVDKRGRKILSPDPYNNIPKQAAPQASVTVAKPSANINYSPLLTPNENPTLKIVAPVNEVSNKPKPTLMLDNPNNALGFADAQGKLNNATYHINQKNYDTAKGILAPLKLWLVDATEAHINLYKTLDNVSTAKAQAELEKQVALQFALLRDQAIYQLARIGVAEKSYRNAVKDLTDVVKSQPRSEIGIKAYQLLQDIGFTEKLQLVQ